MEPQFPYVYPAKNLNIIMGTAIGQKRTTANNKSHSCSLGLRPPRQTRKKQITSAERLPMAYRMAKAIIIC